jgi:hypothetical protein
MDTNDKRELNIAYVNLKDHFDAILIEREKKFDLHFQMIREALDVSSRELERRLEGLNQLRAEYTSDRTHDRQQYVRQETYDQKILWYDDWVRTVDKKLTESESSHRTWLIAIGIFFTILQVLLKYWH